MRITFPCDDLSVGGVTCTTESLRNPRKSRAPSYLYSTHAHMTNSDVTRAQTQAAKLGKMPWCGVGNETSRAQRLIAAISGAK